MAREINHVIDKLYKIEASSNNILSSADKEKQEYALVMEQKTKDFDDALYKETESKLEQVKAELSAKVQKDLEKWKIETEDQLKVLDDTFAKNHEALAKIILERIIAS